MTKVKNPNVPQSKGGRATGIVLKERARQYYLSNPNYCLYCGKMIEIDQKIAYVRKKKFCNRKCAGHYNGKGVVKNKEGINGKSRKIHKLCSLCGKKIDKSKKDICPQCNFENTTKGQLFARRKNWQSARNAIRVNAANKYIRANMPKVCAVCGYNKTFEVCHKKPVSKFEDSDTMSVINNISNLVALCPNHHWEFDHGLLLFENAVIV